MNRRSNASRDSMVRRRAEQLYGQMSSTIASMIDKLERFDTGLDRSDMEQQAYLAIHEAIKKYQPYKNGKKSNMKLETYAFWYLQKHLHKTLDANSVIYDVYNSFGHQIGSYHGKEYYQKKYSMPEHTVKTRRAVIDLAAILSGDDGDQDWTEQISKEELE